MLYFRNQFGKYIENEKYASTINESLILFSYRESKRKQKIQQKEREKAAKLLKVKIQWFHCDCRMPTR